jgi:hypothetical protein
MKKEGKDKVGQAWARQAWASHAFFGASRGWEEASAKSRKSHL